MRLKLTLERTCDEATDIVVTADASATVGDVAAAIAAGDPHAPAVGNGDGPVSLRRHRAGELHDVIPADALIAEAGVCSGAVVSLAFDADATNTGDVAPAAYLRILEGADAGTDFPLRAGANEIGRGRSCQVRLHDPLMSKRHARIVVGRTVEIVDLGSANGVIVGDGVVQRAVLAPGQIVTLGGTVVEVVGHRVTDIAQETRGTSDAFNRPPTVARRYTGRQVLLPNPPTPAQPPNLPKVTLLMPLLLGLLLFALTRSVMSVAFVAMIPLLMLGTWWEGKSSVKRKHRSDLEVFVGALDGVSTDLKAAIATEQKERLDEHPSTAHCVAVARARGSSLWTRRPDDESFLALRLGLGEQGTRHTVNRPNQHNTTRELWEKLEAVASEHASVSDVPVVADLKNLGSIGVAGPESLRSDAARALVLQLATLHSPAEVVVAAVASTESSGRWEWLKWLPHISSPQSPLGGAHLAASPSACVGLVAGIEGLVETRRAARAGASAAELELPAVVLLVEDDAPVERSRLVEIAECGREVSVHVIWCAGDFSRLPAACRAWVEATTTEASAAKFASGSSVQPLCLEVVDAETTLDVARGLSGLVDAGARQDDASDLPTSVPLLSLTGPAIAHESGAVLERWRESGSLPSTGSSAMPAMAGSLRALVGQAGADLFHLDLRTQGPHALVGGTTGSGKSELLQSWVLGMAAAHSPRRVTFLFVDYKGGSAFGDCVDLPHAVGLVTDLTPHLVRRALTSLNAELRHRERLLSVKDAKDLVELERRGDPDAPPSLVIVVDEFAALVHEVPEFVEGVVNIAQRGRSLGLHLIVATQRPAGVITGNLRANTNLRIALRMADEEDSVDVLGSPLAAGFDPEVPGRAAAKSGPGRLVQFQAAYVGGRTSADTPPPAVLIEELCFGRGEAWKSVAAPAPARGEQGPADIDRIVATIGNAAATAGIATPRKPWLPELARRYDLGRLPNPRTDEELILGVADNAAKQTQPVVGFAQDRDGNMAVFGTGGSGKSVALRTAAVAAGLSAARGGPCHVFGLDFGAGGLRMLEDLPHVGSVISGDDHERVVRLLRWLREQVEDRSVRYAAVRAGSIGDYRRIANRPDEPRLLLLVDGLSAFREHYEYGDQSRAYQAFQSVVLDGRQVGVHVIVSADRPGAVPSALGSAIQRRLVLRLADEQDYAVLGAPTDVLSPASPAGRGLTDGQEIQVAVLGGTSDVAAQAQAVTKLANTMRKQGVLSAPQVRRLPELMRLSDLPETADGLPTLGLSGDTLEAVGFDPIGTFLVAGPPASGRTTAMATLVASLQRWNPKLRLTYLGKRRSPLHGMAEWSSLGDTADEVATLADELVRMLQTAEVPERSLVVVIEGVSEFISTSADTPLQDLIKSCCVCDQIVLAESEVTSLTQSWQLLNTVKAGRRGIALQPEQADGDPVFRTRFPRVTRAEFVQGRGLLVGGGRTQTVQVAVPE